MLATESMHLRFLQQKPTVNVTETESVKRSIKLKGDPCTKNCYQATAHSNKHNSERNT